MKHIILSLNSKNYVKFQQQIFYPLLLNYCLSEGIFFSWGILIYHEQTN